MFNKKTIWITVFFFTFTFPLFSQTKEEPKFGINFNGYVKTDAFYDTRQTVSLREGHLLMLPADEVLDKNGKDINSKSNFNILSIQTRLTGKITAPDAFGAKTSGVIEAEFFGNSDADVNGVRMRHAYVKLDWDKTSLLVGQYWHPMFAVECYPTVISINTGAPFHTFIRAPQVRLTHSFGSLNFIAAASAQRDFNSNGPQGFSSAYLRNTALPNLHLQFQYKLNDNLFGLGLDYKSLTPKLSTSKNYISDETVNGFSAIGYIKLNLDPITLKMQGTYGQNLMDMMMLGGYAVQSIDTVTGIEKYTTLNNAAFWCELIAGKEVETAIFFGYTKYLGASENIAGPVYTRINNIESMMRIAPRIQLTSGKTKFAAEIEYTSAAYGTTNYKNKAQVENTRTVDDLRILLAAFYFF